MWTSSKWTTPPLELPVIASAVATTIKCPVACPALQKIAPILLSWSSVVYATTNLRAASVIFNLL